MSVFNIIMKNKCFHCHFAGCCESDMSMQNAGESGEQRRVADDGGKTDRSSQHSHLGGRQGHGQAPHGKENNLDRIRNGGRYHVHAAARIWGLICRCVKRFCPSVRHHISWSPPMYHTAPPPPPLLHPLRHNPCITLLPPPTSLPPPSAATIAVDAPCFLLELVYIPRLQISQVVPFGEVSFSSAVRVAHLALKHRQGKNHRMRIICFIGSPIVEDDKDLVKLAKRLKKEKVRREK